MRYGFALFGLVIGMFFGLMQAAKVPGISHAELIAWAFGYGGLWGGGVGFIIDAIRWGTSSKTDGPAQAEPVKPVQR
jgi:hypothetical protein